jgi:hypothetical protein
MQSHGAKRILALWEAGRDQGGAQRALAMLEFACPDRSPPELAQLPLGRRDALLLAARRRTIGETLLAVSECPACNEQVEISVPCTSLMHDQEHEQTPEPFEDTLNLDGYEISFRLLNSEDLIAADQCCTVEEASQRLVERCVGSALHEGRPESPQALPRTVVTALAERMTGCDPQAETVFELTCPACNENWCCELDFADFFWKELRAHALRLLDDVHKLACAYGWSEKQILALSPARREWYLERVQA